MVNKTETTQILTTPKLQMQVPASLGRCLKHFFYLPLAKRMFHNADQHAIAEAVQAAESGHIGEIQVVIEGHIPASLAYRMDCLLRARHLFAELGVWDTQYNSGVLLYLNLCEQQVEIVIDRGLQQLTTQARWDQICAGLVYGLKNKDYRIAVCQAIAAIGEVFQEFDQYSPADHGNELSDLPIILN